MEQNKSNSWKINSLRRNKCTACEILIGSVKVELYTDTFPGFEGVLKSENSKYQFIPLLLLAEILQPILMDTLFL